MSFGWFSNAGEIAVVREISQLDVSINWVGGCASGKIFIILAVAFCHRVQRCDDLVGKAFVSQSFEVPPGAILAEAQFLNFVSCELHHNHHGPFMELLTFPAIADKGLTLVGRFLEENQMRKSSMGVLSLSAVAVLLTPGNGSTQPATYVGAPTPDLLAVANAMAV